MLQYQTKLGISPNNGSVIWMDGWMDGIYALQPQSRFYIIPDFQFTTPKNILIAVILVIIIIILTTTIIIAKTILKGKLCVEQEGC